MQYCLVELHLEETIKGSKRGKGNLSFNRETP